MSRTIAITKVGATTVVKTSTTEKPLIIESFYFNKKTNYFVKDSMLFIQTPREEHPDTLKIRFSELTTVLGATTIEGFADALATAQYFTGQVTV